jgi:CRP-like cAMP-binding protein
MTSAEKILQNYLLTLQLEEPVVDEITGCFKSRYYPKNDYFSFVGQANDKLGFVIDGLFCMHTEKPGGVIFTKGFLRNQEFLLATFDPQEESLVHIQAVKDSLILEAKYSDIQRLFARHADFRQRSERGMQKRYQAICDRLELLATLDATGRYLAFQQEYGDLEEDIPQYLIASYVGVTPTQLSRIRKKLNFA